MGFWGFGVCGCVNTVLAPRLAILDPEIKLIFVLLGGKLLHVYQLLLPKFILFFCSFRGRDCNGIDRLVDVNWNNHCFDTVSDEHLFLSDPLFDEIDDFARLAIGCPLIHV